MDHNLPNSSKSIAQKSPIIVLLGPTAIGKTELSLQLAEELNAEIVGVDSMQIYKYMDIGTAKPTPEERKRVMHHLIDFIDPASDYSVARFIQDAEKAVKSIWLKGRLPLMVGGTGLYLRGFFEGMFQLPVITKELKSSLQKELVRDGNEVLYDELKGCDPESAQRIHLNDSMRLMRALEIYRSTGRTWSELITEHQAQLNGPESFSLRPLKIGLKRDRQELYERINQRVELMVEQGIVNEVERLLAKGYNSGLKSMQSLGYRHIGKYLSGEWSWAESLELLARDTRRYAKRQLTWFRKDAEIIWFEPSQKKEIFSTCNSYLETHNQLNKTNM